MYIRKVYFYNNNSSCFGVILQNIWNAYGLTFTDGTLLYSVLALVAQLKLMWVPSQQIDHYTFVSQFHNNLLTAIKRIAISECHFFARIFELISSKRCNRSIHAKGLVNVLRLLNKQHEKSHSKSSPTSLPLRFVVCSTT